MARLPLIKSEDITDPEILGIFAWVTEMEGSIPNHFLVELNFPDYFKAKLGSTKILWEQGELSMEEIQHIGILVSRANRCSYCTAAFCTIFHHGLGADQDYISQLLSEGITAIKESRLRIVLEFALKINGDPSATTDEDVEKIR